MKKIVFLMLAAGVMMMVGCKKTEEGDGPTGGNGTDTVSVVKHNVELVYGLNDYVNISLDTIRKYNNDNNVDTIFMVPNDPAIWGGSNMVGLQSMVNSLRKRHNVNPNKVFGKGELQLRSDAVENHPEIPRFFADTLKYNVVIR